MPMSYANSGLVLLPSRLEDLTSLRPPGVDFALTAEAVAFHEAGHIFAHSLKIDGGGFVNELVANIFMAAFIRAARPDLRFLLQGPFATAITPRYTSGADLVYLRAGVGADNYFWFQSRLHVLADFCVKRGSFASVIENLRRAFPGGPQYMLQIGDTIARLDTLFPGFHARAGELASPSTIRPIVPAVCPPRSTTYPDAPRQMMVVRNNTPSPLVLTDSDGETAQLKPGFWARFDVTSGAPVRLPDGTCLVVKEEPGLAIIDKLQPTRR
jgi:hypothetical protein